MNCRKEDSALLWAVMRVHNCGLPVKHDVPGWPCRAGWRVPGQTTKFPVNPFQRRRLCGCLAPRCRPVCSEFQPNSWLSRWQGRTVSWPHTSPAKPRGEAGCLPSPRGSHAPRSRRGRADSYSTLPSFNTQLTRPNCRTGCDVCVSCSHHPTGVNILEGFQLKHNNKKLPRMKSLRIASVCFPTWDSADNGQA